MAVLREGTKAETTRLGAQRSLDPFVSAWVQAQELSEASADLRTIGLEGTSVETGGHDLME